MLDIVFEENKYFAIKDHDKIIYTYPSNIKIEDMDKSKQCLYGLKYGLYNSEELSSAFLRVDSNKPFLKSIHYIDDDDGIYFQILNQNDPIRGDFFMPIFIGKEINERINIKSASYPDIDFNNIYLRGTARERDKIKVLKFIGSIKARIILKILDDLNNKSIHQVFLDSLSGIYKKL